MIADSVAARLSAWRPPGDSIGIVALGQAGFALRSHDDLVLIDPFLTPRPERLIDPPVDPRDLRGVTAVLATHEHGDHLDLPTWVAIAEASPNARFVVPEPLVPLVAAAGVPPDRVTGARIGVRIQVGGLGATPVPARHAVHVADGYSLGDLERRTPRWIGYVVELAGVRIYHAGDTIADDAIIRAVIGLRPDIALLPINGRDPEREQRDIVGNMSPDEAARTARNLSVPVAIPMHFDTIRGNEGPPDEFVRAMRLRHPSASIWIPAIGAALVWPSGTASGPAETS